MCLMDFFTSSPMVAPDAILSVEIATWVILEGKALFVYGAAFERQALTDKCKPIRNNIRTSVDGLI